MDTRKSLGSRVSIDDAVEVLITRKLAELSDGVDLSNRRVDDVINVPD
jgi:hypothetical protein